MAIYGMMVFGVAVLASASAVSAPPRTLAHEAGAVWPKKSYQ